MTDKLEDHFGSVAGPYQAGWVVQRQDLDRLLLSQTEVPVHDEATYPNGPAVHHGLVLWLDGAGVVQHHDLTLESPDDYPISFLPHSPDLRR
jgi:hypothetical protein